MERINSVSIRQIHTNLPKDFVIANTGISRVREHLIIQLETDKGRIGLGEACPLATFTGETVVEVEVMVKRHFSDFLIGTEVSNIPRHLEEIKRSYPHHPSACAAIDMAYYDLLGKIADLSVASLLGGARHKRVPLYKAIGIGSETEMISEAEELIAKGFSSLKIKVGADVSLDCRRVKAIRQTVGDSVQLIVDGNEGYTVGDAIRAGRFFSELGVAYFEQPVHRGNIEGLKMVRNSAGISVMADESLCSPRDAILLAEGQAVDLFGIKLVKCGGIGPAKQIIDIAASYQIPVVLISPFETTVAVSAALQLAATLPEPIQAQGLGTSVVTLGNPFESLKWEKGSLLIPEGPGLGLNKLTDFDGEHP